MERQKSTNGLVLVLALCCAALATIAIPASARAALPALGATDDGRLVDATGREVLLRGVNADGLSEAPKLAPMTPRTLRAVGWNAVRVTLSWSKIEPLPGRADVKHFAAIERVVDALAAEGLYSVLAVQPQGLAPGLPPVVGARTSRQYALTMRALARRFAPQPGVAGFDIGDAPAGLALDTLNEIRAGERDAGSAAPHLVFVAQPLPGQPGVVYAPRVALADALGGLRTNARGLPVVIAEWTPGADAARYQDALNGLRYGAFATPAGLVDPRGALARAYVRAAPGRLEFSHYEEPRGHFAARGVAPADNAAPVEIFYPQGKHREARFRARGIAGLRAVRMPGGARAVRGIPRGKWSFQIGPQLK